jgi:hypothetical protein
MNFFFFKNNDALFFVVVKYIPSALCLELLPCMIINLGNYIFKNAFLNGELEEDSYINQSKKFIIPRKRNPCLQAT